MATLRSTEAVAAMLGLSVRTVQHHCKELKIKKLGSQYLLTAVQVGKINKRAHKRRGRPALKAGRG